MDFEISPALRVFIARHIVSLEELEILLMLQEGKDRDWCVAEINEKLRSQETSIRKWLDVLVSLGLAAESNGRFQYAPKSKELAREVTALAEAYRERRIRIIELIFGKPNESLLTFIRAFDLRDKS